MSSNLAAEAAALRQKVTATTGFVLERVNAEATSLKVRS